MRDHYLAAYTPVEFYALLVGVAAAALVLGLLFHMLDPRLFESEPPDARSFFKALGVGFLLLVATPAALILCALTVVGIPIAMIGCRSTSRATQCRRRYPQWTPRLIDSPVRSKPRTSRTWWRSDAIHQHCTMRLPPSSHVLSGCRSADRPGFWGLDPAALLCRRLDRIHLHSRSVVQSRESGHSFRGLDARRCARRVVPPSVGVAHSHFPHGESVHDAFLAVPIAGSARSGSALVGRR